MKFQKEIPLKGGEVLLLRSLGAQDAQQALAVCKKTAGETLNLIRYEDEWTMTLEQETAYLKKTEDDPKSLMLGAFIGDTLVGVGSFLPCAAVDRARHRAELGISILKAYWGRGIGTAIMQTLVDEVKKTSAEQLELEVVATNERAIRLYERFGFVEHYVVCFNSLRAGISLMGTGCVIQGFCTGVCRDKADVQGIGV